jgi:(1->4)-alpha-D-glucan 1-alpha-D-glucosylmutase
MSGAESVHPRATYRLQFNKDFRFENAAATARYLSRLGISHAYASPVLKARPGSLHGYDIVDHHTLNPELGDECAFDAMVDALHASGLGLILDFVPNHMGVGGEDNPLWLDVLEWGRDAGHAGWFDIDWNPDRLSLRDKLLIPFLGNQYGVELYDGKLNLKFDEQEGSFAVWAYDVHKLPVCPLHYQRILGDAHPELERLGDAFATLREWRPQVTRRARELKAELAATAQHCEGAKDAIRSAVRSFNGTPGAEESWSRLNGLIEDQLWRAAHFRVAGDDINYRRFFDINDLAGLRMELPRVFEHAHALVFRLLETGKLDGLRIDHVDGLLNPREYLQRLRRHCGERAYVVVEKILAHHESLREGWPVQGTTGYEFTNLVLGLLIDPAGEAGFTEAYGEFTGDQRKFTEIVRDCKRRIMRNEMASELNVLAREAARVASQQPRTADFTQNVLRRALREIVACFPVYRIYIDSEGSPTVEDRRDFDWAMKQARANESDIDPSVFDFVGNLLSGDLVANPRSGFSRHAVLRCAMKFQQYSGPVMAKGMEDTAFYRYNRFIALNEVGGSPDTFGITLTNFHKANGQRGKYWPHSMLATSTHDTKRGEDARARLAVLSEMPDQWSKQVRLWSHMLRARRGDIEAAAPPDRFDEYFFYQMLAGSFPAEILAAGDVSAWQQRDWCLLRSFRDRLKQAMTKSMREAKLHSKWESPNNAYEDAVRAFIDGALDPESSKAFLAAFLPLVEKVARLGAQNSLVQTVLKLTVPGVPDIYQGAELWDLSLVDPDNRRPVDYGLRARMLDRVEAGGVPIAQMIDEWHDGAVKLFVTSRMLKLIAAEPELFAGGDYEPILAAGPRGDCICAFGRSNAGRMALVVTARFPFRREAEPGWEGTTVTMPERLLNSRWRNIFTGEMLCVRAVSLGADVMLSDMPVAVFEQA